SPDDMVGRYGADSTRMYTLFATAPDRELDWQDEGVEGVQRFLSRVYRFVARNAHQTGGSWAGTEPRSPESRRLQRKIHQTIKRVSDDFQGRWHFNTCIAAVMELTNDLYAAEVHVAHASSPAAADNPRESRISPSLLNEAQRTLALLLAPFAPYLAHELW